MLASTFSQDVSSVDCPYLFHHVSSSPDGFHCRMCPLWVRASMWKPSGLLETWSKRYGQSTLETS